MDKIWDGLKPELTRAIEDAQYWENVCDQMVEVLGATGIIIVPTNPDFRGQWMSCSSYLKTTLSEYLEGGWHLRDPRERVTTLMLEKGIATDDDVFPERRAKHDMPFYKNFLCKYNFGNLSALKILTPNGYWGVMVHYGNDHPGLDDDQRAKLNALRPILEAAASQAFKTAHKRIASFAQFFSGTNSEVYILDAHGSQTLRMDNFGKLITTNGVQNLFPADLNKSWHEELIALCSSDPSLSLSKAYHFREDAQSITVLIIQAPPDLRHYFMPLKVCAIRTNCSETTALQHEKLRNDYALTDAEISTLELLSSGKSTEIISNILGLKTTSVRQRLKRIFEKTFVNSQVELVAFYRDL